MLTHHFQAVAFVQNLTLKELVASFADSRLSKRDLHVPLPKGGDLYLYSFGAAVFRNAAPDERDASLLRLRTAVPGLTEHVRDVFTVTEEEGARAGVKDGALVADGLHGERARVVALTLAQSAAMELYEGIVEKLFLGTAHLVDELEAKGTVSARPPALHRFIGQAVSTRNEVLSVLHLLDKPDATWDDPVVSTIYDELRVELDLKDRYEAMETKLRSVQESLELVLDVARDRRLVLLEATVVILILLEIVLSLVRPH